MFSLDHLLIQEKVLSARFACDVQSCKGACCTLEGGAGAPLLPEELELVRQAVPIASKYLSERSKRYSKKPILLKVHREKNIWRVLMMPIVCL